MMKGPIFFLSTNFVPQTIKYLLNFEFCSRPKLQFPWNNLSPFSCYMIHHSENVFWGHEGTRRHKNTTRDLAPKANVLRGHHRHRPQWKEGWHFPWGGVAYPWGGWLWSLLGWRPAVGVASMGGGSAKPKVLLLAKPLELQYYFAPFSKAAK